LEKLLSYSQFAKLRGVSQPMVSKYVKIGAISKEAILYIGRRPKITPSIAEADLKKYFNRKSNCNSLESLFDEVMKDLPDLDELMQEIEIMTHNS
jgi:predicted transcriptional regulator